ncbi:Lrp/AsnC family transcriptional regulator [Herbiconiux moechotypicola]|uniref:Lrp/AsnC family transcriptional regulator n=1 Tax=Herbiconiux moechotypicola TaxID=637393 RepID=A0ABN3DEH1_9MICO|nr:Lrp/AsnC family transcriptional regulator [Herbiconiux moechotypicola]MCS5729274.1 Lrp/AsnC family transcriptional regulator [Herbiconiux moechotypicola]
MTDSRAPGATESGRDDELDEFDLAIVAVLRDDPRAAVSTIATRVGATRVAVQQRIALLVGSGRLRVFGLVDPASLGRPVLVKATVVVEHSLHSIVTALAGFGNVHWIVTLRSVGQFVITLSAANPTEAALFVEQNIQQRPGVVRADVEMITAVFLPETMGRRSEPWLGVNSPTTFSETDRAIIDAFRDDGRVSFTRLAAITGLTTPAARQRALRLLESKTIRLQVHVLPSALGLVSRAEAYLRVTGETTRLAEAIAALPGVYYVSRVLGRSEIHAEFCARSDAELLDSVRQLHAFPAISSWELHSFDTVVHESPAWA